MTKNQHFDFKNDVRYIINERNLESVRELQNNEQSPSRFYDLFRLDFLLFHKAFNITINIYQNE